MTSMFQITRRRNGRFRFHNGTWASELLQIMASAFSVLRLTGSGLDGYAPTLGYIDTSTTTCFTV